MANLAPGLKALTDFISVKNQFDMNTINNEYQRRREKSIYDFNNFINKSFETATNKEELNNIANQLVNYSYEFNLQDDVKEHINTAKKYKEDYFDEIEKKQNVNDKLLGIIGSNSYYDYNGTIANTSSIYETLKKNNLSNEQILSTFDNMEHAQYDFSFGIENNRVKMITGMKSKTNRLNIDNFDIYEKDGIGYYNVNGNEKRLAPDEQEEYQKFKSNKFSENMRRAEFSNSVNNRLDKLNERNYKYDLEKSKQRLNVDIQNIMQKTLELDDKVKMDKSFIKDNEPADIKDMNIKSGKYINGSVQSNMNTIRSIVQDGMIEYNSDGNKLVIKEVVDKLKYANSIKDMNEIFSKYKGITGRVREYLESLSSVLTLNDEINN